MKKRDDTLEHLEHLEDCPSFFVLVVLVSEVHSVDNNIIRLHNY